MCGITGIISKNGLNNNINYDLYESLLNIQHRGQDACGYVINYNHNNEIFKGNGLVKHTINIDELKNKDTEIAIGHTRYPTTNSKDTNENQPFNYKTNYGLSISIVHNGNLYDYQHIKFNLINKGYVFSSNSDTEVMLYFICDQLQNYLKSSNIDINSKFFLDFLDLGSYDNLFDMIMLKVIKDVIYTFKGAFSIILLIDNYGLICFRDKYGIRPLCYGENENNILISSESISLETLNYKNIEDIEQIYIFKKNNKIKRSSYSFYLTPCIFEYIYLSRPETTINNISVYEARTNMGYYLARKLKRELSEELLNINAIIPVPDSSIIASTKIVEELNIPLRFGIIKNRYIDRTFIMKNQVERNNNIKRKLFIIKKEVYNKNIIVVDDSIVRGNTSKHIINELRENGVNKIYFISCSPQIKYKNLYGIDLPEEKDLIAHNRTNEEIAEKLGADKVIYLDIEDLKNSLLTINPNISNFELSVFNGIYVS